jgi:hypothetical protein
MGRSLLLGAIAALAAAASAPAVEIDLFGRLPPTRFHGSGCGVNDTASLTLPQGAQRVRRDPYYGVGTPIAGPYPFEGEGGGFDGDYAHVTGFAVSRTAAGRQRATFTVTASRRWCEGFMGDLHQPAQEPRPASEVPDASSQQDYHAGWATFPTTPYFRYALVRKALYSVDTRGHVRSQPPASMAVSVHHPLVARELTWRKWGEQSARARGVLAYKGARPAVFLELYNTDLGGDREGGAAGCPKGRAYYRNLLVSVPAWGERTTFGLGESCRALHVDNSAGDLRPPA